MHTLKNVESGDDASAVALRWCQFVEATERTANLDHARTVTQVIPVEIPTGNRSIHSQMGPMYVNGFLYQN